MTGIMLFCVAEEAKPFVRKAMNDEYDGGIVPFFLVESKVNPKDEDKFKQRLQDDDTIESEFIGATEQECQDWLLREQEMVNFMNFDFLVIADARSAKDETLLVKIYSRDPIPYGDDPDEVDGPQGGNRRIPPKAHTWYDFRVPYKEATHMHASLEHGDHYVTSIMLYERNDEVTDENGVFSMAKVEEMMRDPSFKY